MLIGPERNKKMQERPENEPSFNHKNKTDRKILVTIVIALSFLLVLIVGIIIIYVSGIWH